MLASLIYLNWLFHVTCKSLQIIGSYPMEEKSAILYMKKRIVWIWCIVLLFHQGFYEEVANPLLTDVIMIYIGGTNLTKTNFSQYYNGSEIVVAGQITDNNIETFVPRVVALSVRKAARRAVPTGRKWQWTFCNMLHEHTSLSWQQCWFFLQQVLILF